MQSKQLQEKEYTMNSITCDHTHLAQACVLTITNMHAFSISRIFDLLACMHGRTCMAFDYRERVSFDSSSLLAVNMPTPSQVQL